MEIEEIQPHEDDPHTVFQNAVASFKQNIHALNTALQSGEHEVSPEAHTAIMALGKKVEELHAANN